MNASEIVKSVIWDNKPIGLAFSAIDAQREQHIGEKRIQQRLNVARRLLIRWNQLQRNEISLFDFFAVLRDYILFCGRIQMPRNIADEILRHGSTFGLVCEDEGSIRCDLTKPNWFPIPAFVRQIYNDNADLEEPMDRSSIGDSILYKHTGFNSYRSFEQKIAIHTALNMSEGYSLLVSLATGAGKSLIGQILCAETNGLTVVVIPTTALGIDQEKGAKRVLKQSVASNLIEAYCGEKTTKVLSELCKKITDGQLKMLITSPEALIKNNVLRDTIETAASSGILKNLIIDEAHIVNDWGALFRPDFQFLSALQSKLYTLSQKSLKTLLLSATLNETSVDYLENAFSHNGKWIALRCDSLRTETRYMIDSARSNAELENSVFHYVCTLPKPMLLYCLRPEEAETWKAFLLNKGFVNIHTFTGETDDVKRASIIRDWDTDQMDIIIATSAFGMGVDKSDVRTVMHVSLPESVNRFYQEVGRAGRDGLPCISMLCHNTTTEKSAVEHFVNSKVLTDEKIIGRWFTMYKDPKAERAADIISLDTNLPPSYFSDDEKRLHGQRNRDWNINVILFFIREGLLEFVDLKFDTNKLRYLLKVRLLKLDVLSDPEKLQDFIAPLRQRELDSSRDGLSTLREMERNKSQVCFSASFTKLFPLAEPCCGGCPQHVSPNYSSQRFLLHNIIRDVIPINTMIGSTYVPEEWQELLISKREDTHFNTETSWKIAQCVKKLGAKVWISGNTPSADQANSFAGMILSVDEADFLINHHPGCLAGGTIITFTDSAGVNKRLCKIAEYIKAKGYPVAYYSKESMPLSQHGKAIVQIINDVVAEDDLMEEFYV